MLRLVALGSCIGFACATTASQKPPTRVKDTVPERIEASRMADGVSEPEATEERFATEQARAIREERKARAREQGERVDVVEDKDKPKK